MSEKYPPELALRKAPPPAINLPPVVWVLIMALIGIHIGVQWGGPHWQAFAVYTFAFIPARLGQAYFPQPPGAALWSFLTYGFLHADWSHVLGNCLWLAVFSKPVQARLGNLRYLILLSLSIIAGAAATLLLHWGEPLQLVGISGGISGLLAAAIPLMYGHHEPAPHGRLRPLLPLEILRDRRALTFSLMWIGLTVLTATSQFLTTDALIPQQVVAWEAHVGGFIVGLIAFYALDRANRSEIIHTLH